MSRQTSLFLMAVITSSLLFTACQILGVPGNPSPSPEVQETVLPSAAPSSGEPAVDGTSMEKEGAKITVIGTYQSPAGPESVGFTLTVDSAGTILDGSAEVQAKNPTSVQRQTAFAAEFSQAITGKKLAQLEKVDRIGGSSLTTGAFNRALAEFKTQL